MYFLCWLIFVALNGYSEAAVPAASGRIQLADINYANTETWGSVSVTVKRVYGSAGKVSVEYSTVDGTAIAGVDFIKHTNQTLTWTDGDASDRVIVLKFIDDAVYESGDETFQFVLHNPQGTTIYEPYGKATITIKGVSDAVYGKLGFEKDTYAISESINILQVPVLRTEGGNGTVTVEFDVIAGEATLNVDYKLGTTSKLTWLDKDMDPKLINITILNDALYEQGEAFTVKLKSPTLATLGTSSTKVTIEGPNDVSSGVVHFKGDCFPACYSTKYTFYEGSSVTVYVMRSGGADGEASVDYTTADDTAVAGKDYTPVSGTLKWADGDSTMKAFLVPILKDSTYESDETIKLQLSGASGAKLADTHASTATITIKGPNDVEAGEIQFVILPQTGLPNTISGTQYLTEYTTTYSGAISESINAKENAGTVRIYIRRRGRGDGPASVVYRTVDKTATAGEHFEEIKDTKVTWASGDTSDKFFDVKLLDNNVYAPIEISFYVELANVEGSAMGAVDRQEIVITAPNDVAHISSFTLNMNTAQLVLTMTFPVFTSTLDVTKLSLQATASSDKISYRFTSATTTSSADGQTVVLSIGSKDLNAIKLIDGLALSTATTYLAAQAGVFQYNLYDCIEVGDDTCVNPVFAAISSTAALQTTTFVADTTRPTLSAFTLDLNGKLLKMHFSEVVNRTTFMPTEISVHDTNTGANAFSLKTSILFNPNPNPLASVFPGDLGEMPADGTALAILLSDTDIASIKLLGNNKIGVERGSTYLSLSDKTIKDVGSIANKVVAIASNNPIQAAASDCSQCGAGFYVSRTCTDVASRVCKACTVCGDDEYARTPCTREHDTVCHPCTECRWEQYASTACSATQNRVCSTCTACTSDEYEHLSCTNSRNRVCLTCDNCALTAAQKKLCANSMKWRRRRMKNPYGCPDPKAKYATNEARLNAAKSHMCGAGRCSCKGGGIGNHNPDGKSFPTDPRCTETSRDQS